MTLGETVWYRGKRAVIRAVYHHQQPPAVDLAVLDGETVYAADNVPPNKVSEDSGMNPKKNWVTTLMGSLALALTGLQIYSNPKILSDPTSGAQVVGQIVAGIGLIKAMDDKGDKAQLPKPQDPPKS